MDNDDINLHLNSIEELILDEEIIVTYPYLSKKLCIHVNESKCLLRTFLGKIRTSKPDLQVNVNYIVSGLCSDNRACTRVVSEEQVQKLRSSLRTVFFEHIYSISKGTVVDDVALSAINNFEDYPLYIGVLKNKSCIKRTSEEIQIFKENSQYLSQNKHDTIKKQQQNIKSGNDDAKKFDNKLSLINAPDKSSKHEVANGNGHKEPSPKKLKNLSKSSNTSQKGIAGFFSKQNGQATNNKSRSLGNLEKAIVKVKLNEIKTKKPEPISVSDSKIAKTNLEKNSSKKLKRTSDIKENKSVEIKDETESLKTIKKNAKVDKKRKRVLKISDSESEEDNNIEELADVKECVDSDNEIPPTPTTNVIKFTSGVTNPKKKRKIIDKTYTDEEGYVLTRKEEVYESDSDPENVAEIKENVVHPIKIEKKVSPNEKEVTKNNRSKTKKKLASPQKGKQTTMMNFFKKNM